MAHDKHQNEMANTKMTVSDAIREIVETHGHVTPQLVVEAAKPKDSPLHDKFEWNNSTAAEKFRLVQAAALIRRIKVTIEAQPQRTINVRAFVNVDKLISPTDNDDEIEVVASSVYVTVQEALTSTKYRAQLLTDCARDIAAFRSKYAALEEAAGILSAMNQFFTTTNQ